MSIYSEEDLAGLTDEERAALEAAGDDDTTTTMDTAFDEGADDGKGTQDGEQANADAGDTAANGAGAEAGDAGDQSGDGTDAGQTDAGADTAAAQPEQPEPGAQQAAPLLVADAPADADAKLAEIDAQKKALTEKFDEGDITAKDFQSQLDALAKQERGIERAMDRAALAADMQRQQEVNNWQAQVQNFTSQQHPEYSTSKVRWMALDAFVKEIGVRPENSHLSGAQVLAMAHDRVLEDLGEAPTKAKAEAQHKPLKGSRAEAPKTLSKVPAADANNVDDSRWAALDRLQQADPLEHEERMMRLSDADREAYLARA